ncbi:conserved protein of unknown function [Burkholderia multivorans]
MSLKADAIETGVVVVIVGTALWYAGRKLGKGVDQVKQIISDAGQAVVDTTSAGWDAAQNPVLPTDSGVPAVDSAAAIGNGVVAAPSNTVNALSFGTLGGQTTPQSGVLDTLKNGPLGAVWSILSGDAFAPAPPPGNAQSAPIDMGNGTGW